MSAAFGLVEAAHPTTSDTVLAHDARQALAHLADHSKAARIDAHEEGEGEGATSKTWGGLLKCQARR